MIFHKTSLKLAGLYLAVMMAISIFFSATIYQVSVQELERGLRRPLPVFNSGGPGFSSQVRDVFIQQRTQSYEEAKDKLIAKLLLINGIILVLGGCLSYYLALRTLKPIEDAHEAQSAFAANASHELRTPITAMRSENEVALMDPNLTLDEAKQQLQSNIEELEKLTALSEGLLSLAQAEGAQVSKEAVIVKDIAAAVTERFNLAAESKHVSLVVKVPNSTTVLANKTAVTEMLAVLVDNAIKYSPKESKVSITAKVNDIVDIQVSDNGPGIPADVQTHIFDRFYRADSSRTKQQVGGYGLGLAIAKGLADANGCKLSVKSTEGKGSTFTLSLPKYVA